MLAAGFVFSTPGLPLLLAARRGLPALLPCNESRIPPKPKQLNTPVQSSPLLPSPRCFLRFGGTVVAGILGLGALYFSFLCNGLSFENEPPKVPLGSGIVHCSKAAAPRCAVKLYTSASINPLAHVLASALQFIAMTVALVVLTMPLAAGCARWVAAAECLVRLWRLLLLFSAPDGLCAEPRCCLSRHRSANWH